MSYNMNNPIEMFQKVKQLESQNNIAEAFKLALFLQRLNLPNIEEINETLRRLNAKLQKFSQEQNSTEYRVKSMLNYLKDDSLDTEKRIQVSNNICALLRDNAARRIFMDLKGFEIIMSLLRNNKIDSEIHLSLVRSLTELASADENLSILILKNVGVNFLIELMSFKRDEKALVAFNLIFQSLITQFSDYSLIQNKKINMTKAKKYQIEIDAILGAVVSKINSRAMTAECRDSLLELLVVNIDYQALNWGKKLANDFDGIQKLMDIASELQEIHYESSMKITGNTRTHVALCLEKVFMCMDCEKSRTEFYEKVMEFLREHLRGTEIEGKVRATAAITALLSGPVDAGNYCLGQQGIIEMMLVMANSEDVLQQCVAAEAIIAAASKKDKGKSMSTMGTGILKTLYQSNNPKIKVRALVGLCKLGSVGGTDAAAKVYSEESTMKLMKACCVLLTTNTNTERNMNEDVKKWAADGLAYLSLDAEVKEALISDKKTLKALSLLGTNGDLSVLFGVVTTYVNLTNSYEKQEIMPEMIELAKFSKQHVPEEHEYDSSDFVEMRCKILTENHITSALVALTRTQSKTSREMICRVFNAICQSKENRGRVVAEGGTKALIKLALENNTPEGKLLAAQALSRIAITNNPEIAFPGQRVVEVVGPIMELLHPNCSGLQNFEALMALTNLAGVGDSVRSRILKNCGFSKIEQYMFEDHEMIKRSAVQCMTNLLLMDEVVKLYEHDGTDRTKYLVILLLEEDLDTVLAAGGALAILTSSSEKSCKRVFDAQNWCKALMQIVGCKNEQLQHRGIVIIQNLIETGGECAQKVVESELFELLMAITQPEVNDVTEKIKKLAENCLKLAEEQKLIRDVRNLNTNA